MRIANTCFLPMVFLFYSDLKRIRTFVAKCRKYALFGIVFDFTQTSGQKNGEWSLWAYLLIVSNACNGVGVLFPSWRTFFQGERKRDRIFLFLCDQIHHTKHQMLHLMYHIILNPKRHQVIYAALSRGKCCREFTHFFGVLF